MPAVETEYLSFDRVADLYEASRYIPPDCLRETGRILMEQGVGASAAPFLDAGVGTGRFARILAERGVPIIGADISTQMLAQARSAAPGLALVRADLRALPFPGGMFGGALIVHVLHLIGDWQRVIREVRRALRPDASLFIGSEAGKRFRARELYFQVALERGLTRPRLGAQSFDAILAYLRETGAKLTRIDEGRLQWTATMRVREMLDICRRNLFSDLWHVPEDVHAGLAAEAERRIREAFSSLETVEEVPAHLALWRATWSAE